MPVSICTSISFFNSFFTSTKRCSGTGARSNWRPPWLDKMMASAPYLAAFFASSTVWIPLIVKSPSHCSRIHFRSSKVIDGSNIKSSSSATVPFQFFMVAKVIAGVVKKFIHHSGRGIASIRVLPVRRGGTVKPFRTSRRRAPATGTSTVRSKFLTPAVWARRTSSILASRSFHIYSWNQLVPFGAALTTSSMLVVPRVDSEKGIPNLAAARAPAISPSVCIMRVKPVGAIPTGIANSSPNTSQARDASDTSCKILGRNSRSKKARRARSSVNSDSAEPSV